MSLVARIIAIGGIGILAWQALAASTSSATGIAYSHFAIGSYVIYAFAGYTAGRFGPLWWGLLAGGGVALIEGIAGWPVAALAGPDLVRLGLAEARQNDQLLLLVLTITAVGAVLGLIGAGVARWQKRTERRRA